MQLVATYMYCLVTKSLCRSSDRPRDYRWLRTQATMGFPCCSVQRV